jgi:hypothetical protein
MLNTEEIQILRSIISGSIREADNGVSSLLDKNRLRQIDTKLAEMLDAANDSRNEVEPVADALGPGATALMVWDEVERQKASSENPLQITRKQLNAIKLIATPSPVWSISPGQPPTICGVPYVVID